MLTSGGAVTRTNLQIDLVNKKVYADLRGENGVAATNHLAVWTFAIAPAAKAPVLAGTSSSLTASGLSITPEALAAVTQAIAATPDFGEIALKSLQNYGTRPAYLANQVTVTNSTSSPARPAL